MPRQAQQDSKKLTYSNSLRVLTDDRQPRLSYPEAVAFGQELDGFEFSNAEIIIFDEFSRDGRSRQDEVEVLRLMPFSYDHSLSVYPTSHVKLYSNMSVSIWSKTHSKLDKEWES